MINQYVDFDLTPEQVCAALTSEGLEVDALEEVQSIKGGLKGLYVGKVLTCEMHPNSDHLHVTTVDLGRENPSQIVCGAPNVAAGQKVIVADLGVCFMMVTRSSRLKNRNCAALRAVA